MPTKDKLLPQKFSECNLNDEFFDSLKKDYAEFESWFNKKAAQGAEAYVYSQGDMIVAFVYLKRDEIEEIELMDKTLPPKSRLKIGTLKLSEDVQGQRVGEGVIGYILWQWQAASCDEVYVTVFDKHKELIRLLTRFGFEKAGTKKNGEGLYIKSKKSINRQDAFTIFPYLDKTKLDHAKMLPINHEFHDTLFPFSELCKTRQEAQEIAAANGVIKIYIGMPCSMPIGYKTGSLIFVYRKSPNQPRYKSVLTSFCTLTAFHIIKEGYKYRYTEQEFLNTVGNKSVFSRNDLLSLYRKRAKNLIVLELVYNGFFGAGHNVNYATLHNEAIWGEGVYPYNLDLRTNDIQKIFSIANCNLQNICM